MGALFGTDGIRGVVGENLTADLAFRTGQAVATVLKKQKGRKPVISIGKDTRLSADMLEAALMAGICSVGGDVMPFGTVPTPAVAYLTQLCHADAGVVISASHNPYTDNGLKVFNESGYKLSDELEALVESYILSEKPMPEETGDRIGSRMHGMRQKKLSYINHLYGSIESDLAGLRILVDCANGAASATAPELFGRFKCHTDFIHKEPNGTNINNGCGSTHMDDLRRMVRLGHYDLGIAFDGDADRCLMVDENGEEIDGDRIMAVCALTMKREGRLQGNALTGTVMSNLGLHEFCRAQGIELICTDVGDRHVLERMLADGYCLGGEQSGHTIFTEFATTGDGQLTALQFLQILAGSGKTASELSGVCPKYPQVLINVRIPNQPDLKQQIMQSPSLRALIAKEEERMAGAGRVLVRPSGTEPLIRVMVEAKELSVAQETAERLADWVKTINIS